MKWLISFSSLTCRGMGAFLLLDVNYLLLDDGKCE